MNATVEAVALFATTGSLICCSTLEMFLRLRTVHTPWKREPQEMSRESL